MTGPVVHCLGPVVLDHIFEVDRIPGPDDKAFVTGKTQALGGPPRNVVAALAHWGIKVSLCSAVGDDAVGATILNQLSAAGVATEAIDVIPDLSTATTTILVEKTGERAILIEPIPDAILAGIGRHLAPGSGDVVVANFFHPDAVASALISARKAGAASFLDLEAPELLRFGWEAALHVVGLADVVLTNQQVMRLFAERRRLTPGVAAVHALLVDLTEMGQRACVTLGRDGLVARDRDATFRLATLPVVPRDTTGAGDRFLAGLVHATLAGTTFPEALPQAAAAAGLFLSSGAHDWRDIEAAARGLTLEAMEAIP